MRISLQNREFSLIIVYGGGAGASQMGHDPVYGRHAGVWEKERTVGGVVLSLFLFHKNYIGTMCDGQEKNMLLLAANSYRRYLQSEILIWRFCAGDRNFSLRHDNQPAVASLGWAAVMLPAKRRQRENRESNWAPKFWHSEGWRSNFGGKQHRRHCYGEMQPASAGSKSFSCFALWLSSQLERAWCPLFFFKYGGQRWNGGYQTDVRQSDSFIVPKKPGNSGGGKGAT